MDSRFQYGVLGIYAIVIIVVAASCTGEYPDDSRGQPGEVVVSLSGRVDTLKPTLEIGRGARTEEETFGNVLDLEVGPDGTIYILDASVPAVRIFDADGRFLRSIGRRGEGPGEFRRPIHMALSATGELWVYDDAARAVIALADDGTEIARYGTRASGPNGVPLSLTWNSSVRS